MSKVLVTGGNGYLATRLIAALLKEGREVRATVRSPASEGEVREAVRRGGANDSGLEVIAADLCSDKAWAAATAGIAEVHHLASPTSPSQSENPEKLIKPAREGTLRVLRAASDAGARRVVLTSSFAAVGYLARPVRDYTEQDWTDPDTPGLSPYRRSKTIAERAAWDFIDREGGEIELVVLNPTFIIGPTLVTSPRSSLVAVKAIAEGTMPGLPRQRLAVVDVRDLAEGHIRAAAAPGAAGKRYLLTADGPTITWLGLAQAIRNHLGTAGTNVTLTEAPGEDPVPVTIHNDRAKHDIGWRPRPAQTTITETIDSLRDLGLLNVK